MVVVVLVLLLLLVLLLFMLCVAVKEETAAGRVTKEPLLCVPPLLTPRKYTVYLRPGAKCSATNTWGRLARTILPARPSRLPTPVVTIVVVVEVHNVAILSWLFSTSRHTQRTTASLLISTITTAEVLVTVPMIGPRVMEGLEATWEGIRVESIRHWSGLTNLVGSTETKHKQNKKKQKEKKEEKEEEKEEEKKEEKEEEKKEENEEEKEKGLVNNKNEAKHEQSHYHLERLGSPSG